MGLLGHQISAVRSLVLDVGYPGISPDIVDADVVTATIGVSKYCQGKSHDFLCMLMYFCNLTQCKNEHFSLVDAVVLETFSSPCVLFNNTSSFI